MAGGRDNERMKLLSCFVTKEFKKRINKEAKQRGMTTSDLIRDILKRELGESKDIGTQRKK